MISQLNTTYSTTEIPVIVLRNFFCKIY